MSESDPVEKAVTKDMPVAPPDPGETRSDAA